MANEQGRMLMHFIAAANPILCKSFVAQDIINLRIPITFNVSLLVSNESAKRFYTTIYPRARVDRDWDGRPATPAESAMLASLATVTFSMPLVQINATPMVFAVQQLGLQQKDLSQARSIEAAASSCTTPPYQTMRTKNLLAIIEILIDSGADLRVLDNAGLSAYDHARILGLDDEIIVKLRPPIVFDGRTIPMPAATHNAQRRITSVSEVNLTQTSRPWEGVSVIRSGVNGGINDRIPQTEVLRRNASTRTNRTR